VAAALIACGLGWILISESGDVEDGFSDSENLRIVSGPNGRILNLVIDREGVFLGEICIPREQLVDYLRADRARLAPDYIIVAGTEEAAYGDLPAALAAARSVFPKVDATVETRPLPVGTRRPRIGNPWTR
jgi:hypothetical protein